MWIIPLPAPTTAPRSGDAECARRRGAARGAGRHLLLLEAVICYRTGLVSCHRLVKGEMCRRLCHFVVMSLGVHGRTATVETAQ